MKKSAACAVIIAAAFLTISSTNHVAQAQVTIPPPVVSNTYAAKFICGVQPDGKLTSMPDAQVGRYSSKINVHNNTGMVIHFRKKVINLTGGGQKERDPVKLPPESLRPDNAMEVVCIDIYNHLNIPLNNQTPPPYIEGFVILEVFQPFHTQPPPPDPFDVAGIYTYTNLPGPTAQSNSVSIAVVVYPAKSNRHPLQ
jgi:hypothetical protein